MLRQLGFMNEATRVEDAIAQVLADEAVRASDLGGSASTAEVADAVTGALGAPAHGHPPTGTRPARNF